MFKKSIVIKQFLLYMATIKLLRHIDGRYAFGDLYEPLYV